MAGRNQTAITEFLLQGLPIESEQKNLFYALFLVMYVTTVLGNLLIIFLIRLDSQLHTPMFVSGPKLCLSLVALSWGLTMLHAMLHTLLMARLCFCADNVIPHFFCDMSALLKLSCSDTQVNELVIFIMGGLILVIPFLLIILSYARIVSSILKVPSARGMSKAFSTCGSHMAVVSLFYGTIIGLYLCPSADNSTVKDMVMAMMYTVVTPMLNPFIYSLRNRDMKGALGRVFCRKKTPFSV
ncbi:PREDICTED: LOW QUALITY PROTEIN: olfactory receptor 1E2-like [Myotis davidii]|uniref:LOW QUALITY PROTEIN: olfactory receptor 1E2-like n=1 Tax=Myotis davidii TaxID=225400 RepID=UPI000767CEC5|nr:PREDICTED: LOW QUALITY PROTEIN: olfactory receptor 1E2-like [Myotis davidii]